MAGLFAGLGIGLRRIGRLLVGGWLTRRLRRGRLRLLGRSGKFAGPLRSLAERLLDGLCLLLSLLLGLASGLVLGDPIGHGLGRQRVHPLLTQLVSDRGRVGLALKLRTVELGRHIAPAARWRGLALAAQAVGQFVELLSDLLPLVGSHGVQLPFEFFGRAACPLEVAAAKPFDEFVDRLVAGFCAVELAQPVAERSVGEPLGLGPLALPLRDAANRLSRLGPRLFGLEFARAKSALDLLERVEIGRRGGRVGCAGFGSERLGHLANFIGGGLHDR